MVDDLIAAVFEADPGLERIEIAVELLAFGTSSGHRRLHVLEGSEWNWSEMGSFRYLFYTKDVFCKHKYREVPTNYSSAPGWAGGERIAEIRRFRLRRRRKGQPGSKSTGVRLGESRRDQEQHSGRDRSGTSVQPSL